MKNLVFTSLIALVLSVFSCKNANTDTELKKDTVSNNKHLEKSVLWFQKSAEMRAIYYQTYNWAKIILDKRIAELPSNTKKAIIVDIDETILDNSPYMASLIKTSSKYNEDTWHYWVNLTKAGALPGAVDFLNYAKTKNVEVFYISNRRLDELQATMKNLDSLNFPYIDTKYFLFRTDEKSKELRRKLVSKDYEIIMLIGDNLLDVSEVFENRQNNYGFGLVDSLKNEFGNRFFILPNPMYGDWEDVVISNQ